MKRALLASLLLLFVPLLQLSCGATNDEGKRTPVGDLDERAAGDRMALSVAMALKAANKTATELGYRLEDFTLVIKEEGEEWTVYYRPKNSLQRGGDLTVVVYQRGNVAEVKRGQ